MDKLKQYVALTVVGCLAILAAGWFLFVSPKRTEAADVRAQAAEQESANQQLETQLQVLRAQAKDLPKQQAQLAAVAAKIPDNPALPSLIRALVTASTSSAVELVSITPGTPVVIAPAAPPAPAPAAQTAPSPAAPGAPAAPVGGTAGQLAKIPVTLNVVGGYFQVTQFMSALENLPRAMRVTGLTMGPGANPVKPQSAQNGRTLVTAVSGEVYMAVNRPPVTPVVVPGQPAPTASGAAPAPTASASPKA